MTCPFARRQGARSTTGVPLFEPMMRRYLASSQVRDWLFNRETHPLQHTATLSTAFSYACMYYPPNFVPSPNGTYPLPKPFLDLGDFIVCQRLHDGIALGTLFNPNEIHALALVRDSMMSTTPRLSSTPCARNFAVDLRVKHLEIVEFAWMQDHSLIVACRRLQMSPLIPDKPLVLSADLLFYPVLPAGLQPVDISPLLRMTLAEHPAMCHFCGSVGVEACRCPPSCKVRLPAADALHPSPLSSFFDLNHLHSNEPSISDWDAQRQDPTVLKNALQCWPSYAERVFRVNQVGTFFCDWYQRSPCGTAMVPSYSHRHPIPYQFITGTRNDTLMLTSMYVKRLQLHTRTLRADMRLAVSPHSIQRHSETSMEGEANDVSRFSDGTIPHIEAEASISLDSLPTTDGALTALVPVSTGTLSVSDDVSRNGSRSGGGIQSGCINSVGDWGVTEDGKKGTGEGGPKSRAVAEENSSRGAASSNVLGRLEQERLQKFMRLHVVDNRRCVPCEKTFSKRSNLVRHIQTKHFEIKPFQCTACRRRFGHRNHLKRHEEKLHGTVPEAR